LTLNLLYVLAPVLPTACKPLFLRYIASAEDWFIPVVARVCIALEPADQQFAFVDHFRWQMIMKMDEEFFVFDYFLSPRRVIETL
jgi:hypothetical protein